MRVGYNSVYTVQYAPHSYGAFLVIYFYFNFVLTEVAETLLHQY